MSGEGHYSDVQNDRLSSNPDRILSELDEAIRQMNPVANAIGETVEDSLSSAVHEVLRFMHEPPPIVMGRVVQALPFIGWYKVEVDRLDTSWACSLGGSSAFTPLGVRSITTIPSGSYVLLYRPYNSSHGVILCAVPFRMVQSDFMRPDWVQQGSNSGFKREQAHHQTVKIFEHEGNTSDFSCGRPMDQTAQGEQGWFGPFGTGIFVDDFQCYMRISEICGMFLNWFDHYMRIAGWNLDLETAAHQMQARLDEGETYFHRGYAVYQWEGLGAYSTDSELLTEFGDDEVQFEQPVGKIDETDADGRLDVVPIFRVQEYQGYLGQGGRRIVMRPRELFDNGLEKYSSTGKPEYGLFEENVGLDGHWFVRSSKAVHIAKRLPGPQPKRVKPVEHQEGDKTGNYKFSGKTGGGEDHKIGDIDNKGGDLLSLKQCSGTLDLHAYIYNFKNLHPFHYHAEDYFTPEEEDQEPHDASMEMLDFGALTNQMYMDDPEPSGQIPVDHRYENGDNVRYYKRESYFSLLDDGAVVLGDGFGSEIRMANGHLFLSAPGDIWIQAGRSVRCWSGDDMDLRAKKSIDMVATENDIRIKSEKNMELLSGNAKEGGCIIENRAEGREHMYEPDTPGEDVKGSGVLIRCAKSQFVTWSAETYIRTGNEDGDIDNGKIVLDASKGEDSIIFNAKEVDYFVNRDGQFNLWWGSIEGNDFNLQKADCLSLTRNMWGATRSVQHIFGGDICCVASGEVLFERNLTLVEGQGSQPNSENWRKLEGESLLAARERAKACKESLQEHFDTLDNRWAAKLDIPFYRSTKVGNDETQRKVMFSFRDDESNKQYCSADFKLAETRWQQLARLSVGSGGSAWTEKAVEYQGKELYPYPGKKKWKEEDTFHQLKEYTMFDAGNFRSKARGSDGETSDEYTERALEEWEKKPPDGEYKTITCM